MQSKIDEAIARAERMTCLLEAKADAHRERAEALEGNARKLRAQLRDLRDADERRKREVTRAWNLRKVCRELRSSVDKVAPVPQPHRAGSVKQLVRTRAEELASKLRKAAAPIPTSVGKPGVYALLQGEEVVYVGQSVNVLQRIGNHMDAKNFTAAAYISCPAAMMSALERSMIDALMPRLNMDGTTRASRRRSQ